MKKFLYIILAILGAGLVGYSVSQGWATFDLPMAGIKSHPIVGYDFLLGILTGVFGALGLVVLFIKPKIAIVPALLCAGAAAWFYLNPPMIEEIQYSAEKIVIGAIVGGVLLALAGLAAPKKA
jgi:hypothetical protein